MSDGAAAVEPDRVAAGVVAEEVAGREVLQLHAARLVDDHAVVAEIAFAFCRAEGLVALQPELHCGEPGLVPSIITVLRFIPRMWSFGVVMNTLAPARSSPWAPGAVRLLACL